MSAASGPSARARYVVVSEEYLDGVIGMSVSAPTEWDREVRPLPSALVRDYENALAALREAEDAIRAAWAAAKPRRNRKYAYADLDNDAL